jgi:hypothetical protein
VLKAHIKKKHRHLSADAANPLKGKKGYYAVRGNTATNAADAKILPVQGESKVAERDSARINKIRPQKDGVRKVVNIFQESRRNQEALSSSAKRTLFKSDPNHFKGVEGGEQCIGCKEKLMAAWKLRPSKIMMHVTSQYHIESVAAREMQVADCTRLHGLVVRMKAEMRSPLPDKISVQSLCCSMFSGEWVANWQHRWLQGLSGIHFMSFFDTLFSFACIRSGDSQGYERGAG